MTHMRRVSAVPAFYGVHRIMANGYAALRPHGEG